MNLNCILLKCRDILPAAHNSGSFFEKRDKMLTLVFLRFTGEIYEDDLEAFKKQLVEDGLDLENENVQKAFFDDPTLKHGINLAPEARWSTIINKNANELNSALDVALNSIATNIKNLKGCL